MEIRIDPRSLIVGEYGDRDAGVFLVEISKLEKRHIFLRLVRVMPGELGVASVNVVQQHLPQLCVRFTLPVLLGLDTDKVVGRLVDAGKPGAKGAGRLVVVPAAATLNPARGY
jgi:hypothetical protein